MPDTRTEAYRKTVMVTGQLWQLFTQQWLTNRQPDAPEPTMFERKLAHWPDAQDDAATEPECTQGG